MIIHGDKLRWLFWLRWKMFTRSFTHDKSHIVGTIFLVLFGLPFIGGIAAGTFFAYRYLDAPVNSEILFLVLTGIYLMWMVLPLLEFTVNEGLDVSKLVLFPLTHAELMVSLLLSTLLDIPMVGLILVFIATVAGWAFSVPLALVALLAMLIFYIQVVATSQLVLALFMRTLQSRRFRDLSIIIVALFSSSCYFFQQLAFRELGSVNMLKSLREATISPYLQWLPPGMAARAIQQASIGHWTSSFVWLGGLLVISLAILYLWQLVVARGLSSPESAGTKRVRQQKTSQAAVPGRLVGPTNLWTRMYSSQVFAIALKDLKYFRRDPQLQALLVQSIVSIAIFVAIPLFNSGRESLSFFGTWSVMFAPLFALFSLYSLSYNVLGFERQSLTTLFLFPIEPKRVLWGKNLVVFAIGIVEMVLLVTAAAFVSRSWNLVLPALAIGLAGIGVILGCGNFTSVFLPQKIRQQRGFRASSSLSSAGGCLRTLLSVAAFFVMSAVLVPVALSLVLPVIFSMQWIWIVSIPASLLYSGAFYFAVTALVAPRIVNQASEILATITGE